MVEFFHFELIFAGDLSLSRVVMRIALTCTGADDLMVSCRDAEHLTLIITMVRTTTLVLGIVAYLFMDQRSKIETFLKIILYLWSAFALGLGTMAYTKEYFSLGKING